MQKHHEKLLIATLAGLVIASVGAFAAQPALMGSHAAAPKYQLSDLSAPQEPVLASPAAWAQLQG
jgi:hypothetical protein